MTTLAILIWPVMALILFAKLPVLQAVIWSVLLPYMFLPEAFAIDLPAVPPLNKTNMIAVGLVCGLIVQRPKVLKWLKKDEAVEVGKPSLRVLLGMCFVLAIFGTVMTVFTNQEPLPYGDVTLPAARPRDIVSLAGDLVFKLIPFFYAALYLSTPRRHNLFLVAIVAASLVYSLLMLIEIRLSPQLHFWIYGYYQHSFAQHVRDGFRPMVFMQHGLWVSFFAFSGIIAALGLWRSSKDGKWLAAALWIFLVLALSSNLGALMIAVLLGGVVALFSKRLQLWVITVIAAIVFLFPMLRGAQLLPMNAILSTFAAISQERADSFEFRLDNEDILLEKAQRKPLFGWGGWNRNRVLNGEGRDVSTVDGLWIGILGTSGWVGYLSYFGFLVFPVLFLRSAFKRKDISFETLALGMISAGNLIYIIPNATLTPVGFLIFGAVAGYGIYDTVASSETVAADASQKRGAPQFTRAAEKRFRKPLSAQSRQV